MANTILFNGHFEYHFSGNLNELFDEDTLNLLLTRHYPNTPEVDVNTFLRDNLNVSILPVYKRTSKITFKYSDWQELNPQVITVDKYSRISFIVISENVDVIQILKDDITFANSKNEVLTETLYKELKLFRN